MISACRRAGGLPPEEVLRRATLQNSQLQSVEFVASMSASMPIGFQSLSGTAQISGILANGGEQASFSADAQGVLYDGTDKTVLNWSADVVRNTDDTYLRLREVNSEAIPQGIKAMIGTWWTLARDDYGGAYSMHLTPDPRFIREQSAVVIATDDFGIEDIGGRIAYHYGVSLDPDRLIGLMQVLAEKRGQPFSAEDAGRMLGRYDARGELWIDASRFVVHRIAWTVTSRENPPVTRLELRMDLRNHNADLAVETPTLSRPLDREFLLRTIQAESSFFRSVAPLVGVRRYQL